MLNIPAMPLYTFCAVKLNMWSWNQCVLMVSRQSPGTFTMPPLSSGPPALGSVGQARVEGRAERSGSVDAGIEAGRDTRIVNGVDLGALLRDLDGDAGRERGELLVGPDRPGRAAFDGAGVAWTYALERGVQKLLGGVGLRRRGRIQGRDRVPRQDVEPGHGLRERLDAEERAARRAGRDGCVRAGREHAQSIGHHQRPGGRHEAHADQVPARDVSVAERLEDLRAVLPRILRFTDPGL